MVRRGSEPTPREEHVLEVLGVVIGWETSGALGRSLHFTRRRF